MERLISIIACILISISCTSEYSDTDYESSEQSKKPDVWIKSELERLESIDFGASNMFYDYIKDRLMEDISTPHDWSHWKKEINYLEKENPLGIRVYSGFSYDDGAEEYGEGESVKWNGHTLFHNEHWSFSESGKLLAHITYDSSLFYYDDNDNLRQYVKYASIGREAIEEIKLYNYDENGNLLRHSVFFEDEDGIYMNHFMSYQYLKTDSGVYVKENTYILDLEQENKADKSFEYYYFDNNKLLRRSYAVFPGVGYSVTHYKYKTFKGKEYLTEEIRMDMTDNVLSQFIIRRDDKNRIVLSKYSSRGIVAPINETDSMVYKPNNQESVYSFGKVNSYRDKLVNTSYDLWHNPLHMEYFEFKSLDDMKLTDIFEFKYERLDSGTWYGSELTRLTEDGDTMLEWISYDYRKFLDKPIVNFDWHYQNNQELIDIIKSRISQFEEIKK